MFEKGTISAFAHPPLISKFIVVNSVLSIMPFVDFASSTSRYINKFLWFDVDYYESGITKISVHICKYYCLLCTLKLLNSIYPFVSASV